MTRNRGKSASARASSTSAPPVIIENAFSTQLRRRF